MPTARGGGIALRANVRKGGGPARLLHWLARSHWLALFPIKSTFRDREHYSEISNSKICSKIHHFRDWSLSLMVILENVNIFLDSKVAIFVRISSRATCLKKIVLKNIYSSQFYRFSKTHCGIVASFWGVGV